MDPNETLRRARQALSAILAKRAKSTATPEELAFADHFEALDAWLSRGGVLPDAWGLARGGLSK